MILRNFYMNYFFFEFFCFLSFCIIFISAEMAVTDYKPGKFDIEKENKLKFMDVLSEKFESFTDADFWGNYNIIEPDQSIDKIIGKIVKQLKKRESEK